jgi:hypothetical protein
MELMLCKYNITVQFSLPTEIYMELMLCKYNITIQLSPVLKSIWN